jgi:CPA2 family monovalent cation:H+ antiporter-2
MPHASLIGVLVAGFGLAFLFGTAANRLRLPPIAGYLLAGIAIGPFTPGFVADPNLTRELAEIGVILLMFGVGLHFSVQDLLSVRAIAVPGALLQVIACTALGTAAAAIFGWPPLRGGLLFGLSLSIASTIVTMRALQERQALESERGRILVGWLVLQDVLTVIALVLLPALAPLLGGVPGGPAMSGSLIVTLVETLAKLGAFAALMWLVAAKVIPEILHYVAHTGSRELFRLAVLSLALGVAFVASEVFGVSIALGAFLAGLILSESKLSQQAAAESLPLRDAFAVLFFVSVGMLFNPATLLHQPLQLLAASAVVLLGISGVSFAIVRLLGCSAATAVFIAAGLAQIGEFSFILMDLGLRLKIVSADARDLVLGASIASILLNPALLAAAEAMRRRWEHSPAAEAEQRERMAPTSLTQHAVVVGYGRVGHLVAAGLRQASIPFIVIEEAAGAVERAEAGAVEILSGNAADERLLQAGGVAAARILFVAIPGVFEAGQIVQQSRRLNPDLRIVARAHFDAEVEHLSRLGADLVIMGEREIAQAMLAFGVLSFP